MFSQPTSSISRTQFKRLSFVPNQDPKPQFYWLFVMFDNAFIMENRVRSSVGNEVLFRIRRKDLSYNFWLLTVIL